ADGRAGTVRAIPRLARPARAAIRRVVPDSDSNRSGAHREREGADDTPDARARVHFLRQPPARWEIRPATCLHPAMMEEHPGPGLATTVRAGLRQMSARVDGEMIVLNFGDGVYYRLN